MRDLSGFTVTGQIQFAIAFKIIGLTMLPSRIMAIEVTWDDLDLPDEFDWKLGDSSDTNGTIGFIQTSLFASSVPALQIDYYRSDTNALVLSQASSGTTNGTFEYWNGSAFVAGLGTNTVGLRRRFVPSSGLPNTQVYATIKKI
jgi:hypothetical protein